MPNGEPGRVADALEPMAVGAAVRNAAGDIIDFRVVYVNGPGAALVGHAPDALLGVHLSELADGTGAGGLLPRLVDLLERGEPFAEDLAWVAQGPPTPSWVGSSGWATGCSCGYGGDRPIGATLHELAVSEAKYRLMAELASDVVMKLDADDVI